MSINELFLLILLVITLLAPFRLLKKENRLSLAHPLIFYSLIMFYYTVLSPLFRIILNETSSRSFDFRDQFILGWQGALLSVIGVLLGYSFKKNIRKKITNYCDLDYQTLWRIGLILNIIGLSCNMVVVGFDISAFNPFFLQSNSIDFLSYRGGLSKYLISGIELLTTGNFLMFAGSYSTKKNFPLTLISLVITSGFLLNSGFRYRLFFLFSSIIIFFLTKENKIKVNVKFYSGIVLVILTPFIFTFIGQIRIYSQGFDFNKIQLGSEFLKNIFLQGESSTFITTAGLINIVPEKISFQYFYPIFKALIHPIPSAFFDKNAGDYLFYTVNAIYGYRNNFQGAAYLNFGEYYLMFGWFGVFIFNFLLGYLYKRFWIWINLHKQEPLAILVYILNLTFTFMIISRGYLAQQFHLYIFTVLPLNMVYLFNLKRKLNSESLQ